MPDDRYDYGTGVRCGWPEKVAAFLLSAGCVAVGLSALCGLWILIRDILAEVG